MGPVPLKLVIFDLDGTLLEPALDFAAIRAEIGLEPGAPILESFPALGETQRRRAYRILERHETAAADRSRLMPGAKELLDRLRQRGVKVTVLTRNSHASVRRACQRHGLAFDGIVARGDQKPKPSPSGIRHLMEICGAAPDEMVLVGDFRFDVEAAAAAGCRSIALVAEPTDWARRATWIARNLGEVRRILESAASTP